MGDADSRPGDRGTTPPAHPGESGSERAWFRFGPTGPWQRGGDRVLALLVLGIEYLIVLSLLTVAGITLVRTVTNFVESSAGFPRSVIPAVDGILAVIILLDIVQTVFRHLRSATFPVRPFLVIGILAGVRDILSASAHLTLGVNVTTHQLYQDLLGIGIGVGVVVALLLGLLVLDRVRPSLEDG